MRKQTIRISTVKPDHRKFLFGLSCLSDDTGMTKNTGVPKKSWINCWVDILDMKYAAKIGKKAAHNDRNRRNQSWGKTTELDTSVLASES